MRTASLFFFNHNEFVRREIANRYFWNNNNNYSVNCVGFRLCGHFRTNVDRNLKFRLKINKNAQSCKLFRHKRVCLFWRTNGLMSPLHCTFCTVWFISITIPGCTKRLHFLNILPFSGNNYVRYLSHSEKSKNYAHYKGIRKKFQHIIREIYSDY